MFSPPFFVHVAVFHSYVLVTQDDALLFVDMAKLDPEVLSELSTCVSVLPYESFTADFANRARELVGMLCVKF